MNRREPRTIVFIGIDPSVSTPQIKEHMQVIGRILVSTEKQNLTTEEYLLLNYTQ